MSNNITETTGRKARFHDLYEKDRIKIVIPKIQRDFAYGRPTKTVTTNRSRFLDSICEAINPESAKPLELDFVYGRLNIDAIPHEFEPIDGQQRLTILFLLYLYIGKRSNIQEIDLAFLKQFTYRTRESSQNFCEKLVEIPHRFFNNCPTDCKFFKDCSHYKNIVDYVKDQWWYNTTWSLDPTIASMLGMLETINDRFGGYNESEMSIIWDKIKENIDFWLLTLDDLNATDDLYIKMNSRGKKLTEFEHFKAEIERYNSNSKGLSLKIDTSWTNMLWQYRKTKGSLEELDPNNDSYAENGLSDKFLNLFYRIIVIECVKHGFLDNYPGENEYDSGDILNLASKVLPTHSNEILDRIENILDFFCGLPSVTDFFNSLFTSDYAQSKSDIPDRYYDYRVYYSKTIDFLQLACDNNSTAFKDTLMLEAIFEYAYCSNGNTTENERITVNELKDRLRILRNLQNNLQIHNYEMQGLLNATADFTRTGNLGVIANGNAYTKIQKDQEEFKRDTWQRDHSNKDWLTLITLENTYFLYGNLAPIMSTGSSLEIRHMIGFLQLVCNQPELDSFRRALLSFGDYGTDFKGVKKYAAQDWNRWYREIFIFANKSFAPAFTEMVNRLPVFDDIKKRSDTFEKCVADYRRNCIEKNSYPWLYYMITYDEILNNPRAIRGLYRIGNGQYDHKMVTGTKGKSWNPYLLALVGRLPGATLGNWNDALYFNGQEIWISEREIIIKYPGEITLRREIPCSPTGLDRTDRVEFTLRLLLRRPLQDRIPQLKKRLNKRLTHIKINKPFKRKRRIKDR